MARNLGLFPLRCSLLRMLPLVSLDAGMRVMAGETGVQQALNHLIVNVEFPADNCALPATSRPPQSISAFSATFARFASKGGPRIARGRRFNPSSRQCSASCMASSPQGPRSGTCAVQARCSEHSSMVTALTRARVRGAGCAALHAKTNGKGHALDIG